MRRAIDLLKICVNCAWTLLECTLHVDISSLINLSSLIICRTIRSGAAPTNIFFSLWSIPQLILCVCVCVCNVMLCFKNKYNAPTEIHPRWIKQRHCPDEWTAIVCVCVWPPETEHLLSPFSHCGRALSHNINYTHSYSLLTHSEIRSTEIWIKIPSLISRL